MFFFSLFDIARSMTVYNENAPPLKSAKTENSDSSVQIQIGPTCECEFVRKIPGNLFLVFPGILCFPLCNPMIDHWIAERETQIPLIIEFLIIGI